MRGEINLAAIEPQVAFRQGQRYVPRLLAAAPAEPTCAIAAAESQPFRDDRRYLITGALEGSDY